MTNAETATPNEARGDPDHQGAGEIDLTGLTQRPEQVIDAINDAFVEAEATGGELPEWGARAVAQSLDDRSDAPTPALHEFALTGKGNLETVSIEAMPIYNQPGCSPWVRKQIDYLLTFLLNRDLPADDEANVTHAASGAHEADDTSLSDQATEGIEQHGDAFRAFLSLPDIDQNDPNLIAAFHEFYVGRFANLDKLLDSLTEIADWVREIDMLAERLGIPGYVELDRPAIEAHARDTWDIVTYGGALYAFDK